MPNAPQILPSAPISAMAVAVAGCRGVCRFHEAAA